MEPSTDSGADSHLLLDDFSVPGPAMFGQMVAKSKILQAFQNPLVMYA